MLPTFNRPELILRSVQSVINQPYNEYKLVIFNDGSTSDYSELEELIDGCTKVEYIKSRDNLGINKSRNIMIESFLKDINIDSYFFTLSDDDYLMENSLQIMSKEINKFSSIWYCFNCKSNSKHLSYKSNYFDNSDYLNYEKLNFSDFLKEYKGDKHFVFKLDHFKKIRYPEKYFKNGFEHLFYYKIPSRIQTIPITVKVIEYYEDGLSLSDIYKKFDSFDVRFKELKTLPFKLISYINIIKFFKIRYILKKLISEKRYYKIKKQLGLKHKK